MPLYKQVLIANLKATPKEIAAVVQECAKEITSRGGVIRAVENRGDRRLGYAVEDRRWGELQRHYDGKVVVTQFNTSPEILKEVEAKLKNSASIIRFHSFKIRDPIDTLMNTKKSLAVLKETMTPLTRDARMKIILDKKKREGEIRARHNAQFFQPEDVIAPTEESDSDSDEEDDALRLRYIPEWKRDATFKPLIPEHLEDVK